MLHLKISKIIIQEIILKISKKKIFPILKIIPMLTKKKTTLILLKHQIFIQVLIQTQTQIIYLMAK